MKLKSTLKGERLVLKRTKPSKTMSQKMFALVDKNREHLRPWFPWVDATKTLQDTITYLNTKEKEFEASKKIEYGIYIGPKYIGNIGIFGLNWTDRSGEIGYWLDADHQGKGYITEAVKVLEKYFFEERELNRIVIRCSEHNGSSNQVAKKCEYTFEGRLRQASYSSFLGAYYDTIVYSKLQEDYQGKTLSIGQWLDQKLPDTENYRTRIGNVLVELLRPIDRSKMIHNTAHHVNLYATRTIYTIKLHEITILSKKDIRSGRNLGKNSYELLFKLLEEDGITLKEK